MRITFWGGDSVCICTLTECAFVQILQMVHLRSVRFTLCILFFKKLNSRLIIFMLKCLRVKSTDVCNLLPELKNKMDG